MLILCILYHDDLLPNHTSKVCDRVIKIIIITRRGLYDF